MATYKLRRYLLMTLDPVHIGTGGYRLGRVDNSIVREPGTRIPKIPGTALHGAIRSYAARLYKTPKAAGQMHVEVENPELNPVCYTFGYIKADNQAGTRAYSGVANIFDAHILCFPVYSLSGPVWVSTVQRLKDAGFTPKGNGTEDISGEPPRSRAFLSEELPEELNLGWMMIKGEKKLTTVEAPSPWKDTPPRWQSIEKRIVLVDEALFAHIVNSNLEVRTSVSINPETGAAEDGALFTYEAIPRATFLTMDVVVDDYRGKFPSREKLENRKQEIEDKLKSSGKNKEDLKREKANIETTLKHIDTLKEESPYEWKDPFDVVEGGLELIKFLGVGGMGTRGFGRLAKVAELPDVEETSGHSQDSENSSENGGLVNE